MTPGNDSTGSAAGTRPLMNLGNDTSDVGITRPASSIRGSPVSTPSGRAADHANRDDAAAATGRTDAASERRADNRE